MQASAAQVARSRILLLDDDAQVEVLRAAGTAGTGVLAALASSSRQLCKLARSRLALKLRVETQKQASLVLQSWAAGRPPFSACMQLSLTARGSTECLLATGVLHAAAEWPALQRLKLRLWPCSPNPVPPNHVIVDHSASTVLSTLPALHTLRRLKLDLMMATLGPSSMQHVGQLVQLTRLELYIHDPAEVKPVDLTALSKLTNLLELYYPGPAAEQPAAGPEGPFSLPSSLTCLDLGEPWDHLAGPVSCWFSHLPGCPQLQQLQVNYGPRRRHAADPMALVHCLAHHNRQLRAVSLHYSYTKAEIDWHTAVQELPGAADPVEWHPDAALAALTGLECLVASQLLRVQSAEDWQHLAHLTALSKLEQAVLVYAPPRLPLHQQPGPCLAVLELEGCSVRLGGPEAARLLLACPALERATLSMERCAASLARALPPAGVPLPPHPTLRVLHICGWSTACEGAAAVHFAALAPVLAGLRELSLHAWPQGRGSGPGAAAPQLPDLSACAALTSLTLSCSVSVWSRALVSQQEDFLAMLAPLVQLQRLEVVVAPGLNARAVVPLQHMLPQLQHVQLRGCDKLQPVVLSVFAEEVGQEQQAAEAAQLLAKVQRLLRPGLLLEVHDIG